MGVSWKKPAGKDKPPRRGATPHWVCTRAKVGYDLQLALDPSLIGSDWAPSIHKAPRIATHRPFRAGQAEAPIAA